MRIAELSQRSGVSVATIKFYLREGLLAAGVATGRNQTNYGEEHVRRLRLTRALVEVGGLTVAGTRQVLSALDDPAVHGNNLLGEAHEAIARQTRPPGRDAAGWRAARAEAVQRLSALGWQVYPDSAALDQLADAIAALRELGQEDLLSLMDSYALAMEALAHKEVALVLARGERTAVVEALVTGTVLGEAMLGALRRLAQAHVSAGVTPPGL